MIVLDLEAHKATCLRCRALALCAVGREIVRAASAAILSASRRARVRRLEQV